LHKNAYLIYLMHRNETEDIAAMTDLFGQPVVPQQEEPTQLTLGLVFPAGPIKKPPRP
jgi:hypothetical protein